MKLFNIDQHISGVLDLREIFARLGHTLDDWTLSGHADIVGRVRADVPELAGDNWCGTVSDPARRQAFYEKYRDQLAGYDAFLCFYPPVFARLFEPWGKPIILHIPIRFDYTMENNPEARAEWCEWLRAGVARGQVFLAANNLLDQAYTIEATGAQVRHIPSLCNYTGALYESPDLPFYLYYAARACKAFDPALLRWRHQVLPHGFQWSELTRFRGIVHVPYNVSTMSVFEQYSMNIPLFFPSKRFLLQWYNENLMAMREMIECHREGKRYRGEQHLFPLDQVSFHTVFNREPGLGLNNYLDMEIVEQWVEMADFYDAAWMPHIQYFDGFQDLHRKLLAADCRAISEAMRAQNAARTELITALWQGLLYEIGGAA